MAEVTKKDIQELLDSKIDPFARSVQQEFQSIQQEFQSVKQEFKIVNQRLDGLETDVAWMKKNSSELFTKLDEFITLYKDQQQELSSLVAQLQRLEKRVEQLEARKG